MFFIKILDKISNIGYNIFSGKNAVRKQEFSVSPTKLNSRSGSVKWWCEMARQHALFHWACGKGCTTLPRVGLGFCWKKMYGRSFVFNKASFYFYKTLDKIQNIKYNIFSGRNAVRKQEFSVSPTKLNSRSGSVKWWSWMLRQYAVFGRACGGFAYQTTNWIGLRRKEKYAGVLLLGQSSFLLWIILTFN